MATQTQILTSCARSNWLKPWPKGVASHRKFGNTNLSTKAWVGWPNGIPSRRKLDASHKKAISVQPCVRANPSENNIETNLGWVAKR